MVYQKKTDVQQDIPLSPLPSAVPNLTKETEVHTIDGTMKVVMEKKITQDNASTYTFFVADISGKNKHTLFTKTASASSTMVLPQNSWSPDGKYLFIRENNKDSFAIFVFKASRDAFSNGELYLDVLPLFTKQKTTERITDVTGWDAPTLLHVKTTGPSYWFDIESRSFLQLATK